ncbi:hypothetical protein KFE25_001211 [Diacronema lutheri]|uniref:peptidylprolyl isomerase n=1 Tax=Diacronema lutheri TaxID=2081491 RepID=A0A8J5XDC2_DIALT|nr:hypothetical protein KFE25_001211 [Diacronema lutheri]
MRPAVAVLLLALARGACAGTEEQERILWRVQHTLGQAQLHETRAEHDVALAKLDEAGAILAGWRAELSAKAVRELQARASSADAEQRAAPDEPAAGAERRAEPIEFAMNRTFVPERCERTTRLGSTIKVHFVGKLLEHDGFRKGGGKVFASSFHTGSMPKKFTLGASDVVEGWNQGLVGMCTGERRRLLVPWTLGYGAAGIKGVPPYANLRYDIELVEHSAPKDEV